MHEFVVSLSLLFLKSIDLKDIVEIFLQTPWLWNTKECWYNYPYQVKAF